MDPGKVDGSAAVRGRQQVAINVDGAVRDEDVFVVGDEELDEQVLEMNDGEAVQIASTPPNAQLTDVTRGDSEKPPDGDQGSPGRYYIRPDDTLLGISLRLGINGRVLCKLNDLPPSTLNTTPYLLHTRTFLILPESHSRHATNAPSAEDDTRQTRVRAQIALQRVTKETDWGIVQAYVALAEDSDSEPDMTSLKIEGEKSQSPRRGTTLEERAVDLYLDDDEWERREGRRARVNMNIWA